MADNMLTIKFMHRIQVQVAAQRLSVMEACQQDQIDG